MTLVTDRKPSFLERPVFASLVVNWEMILYAVLFLIAVGTRFYDLGARVMSHDESLHALFSFKLYDGDGYIHDPLMHGPLQFHLVALFYLLFGDNDFAARIPAALFGIALVVLPYWFRPWLGKVGALVTSVGLLISPSLLYYQRYIRNEAFILLFTALLALCLFQYMRTRHIRWLYWGAISVSLSLSSKEVAFIHGFIGVVFIGAAFMWEKLPIKRFKSVGWGLFIVTVVLGGIAFFLNRAGTSEAFSGPKAAGVVLMVAGLLAAILTVALNTDRRNRPVSNTILSVNNPAILIGPLILAAALFLLLHTTFFTNPPGIISGTYGAIAYWLGQQEVARGGQPGYYYLMLLALYEFLPFFVGGIGAIVYLIKKAPSFVEKFDLLEAENLPEEEQAEATIQPSDGGTFAAYLIFWAISGFVIYSWAGEKMPWLNVHVALPFIFLVGHVTQSVFDKFDWQVLKRRDGLLFVLLLPLLGTALLALFAVRPFQGQSLDNIKETSQFLVAFLILITVSVGVWYYSRSLKRMQIKPLLYLVVVTFLTILTIRFAWLSTFVNYDYVNEFLVYAHGAPDVKWVFNEVDDISRRTVGDKQIKVAYGGVIWPLEWYMRDYPNRSFFGSSPTREALDASVVIFSPDAEVSLTDVEPYLGDKYERFEYRQVWWPVEDYKNQSLQKLWNSYVSPNPADEVGAQTIRDNWSRFWSVFFYRDNPRYTLSEWPFMTRMYFYVRKDILNELWDYRAGPLTVEEITATDPYVDVRQSLVADVWGSAGPSEGRLQDPRALAISSQGEIYIADSGNHRIQVFNQSGEFQRAWGGVEGSDPGQLSEPWGIAVSQDGRVYVADTWNHRIQVFDEDGSYLSQFGTFADTQGAADVSPGAFWGPRDIALDAEGNLYVADTGNKRIQKFSADGEFLGAWGGGGIIPGRFEEPTGVAIDSQGNIYVNDTWNQRIQKFDANFNYITEWPVSGWESQNVVNKPFIVVDDQDRVFISDPENYRIVVYSSEGELLSTFGQYGQDVESFQLPLDMTIGDEGALFVLDSGNNRVMRFDVP